MCWIVIPNELEDVHDGLSAKEGDTLISLSIARNEHTVYDAAFGKGKYENVAVDNLVAQPY